MKRSQIVLVTVVFTALSTGILMERTRRVDPFEELLLAPARSVSLEPLVAPRGEHRLAGRVEAEGAADVAGVLVQLTPLAATDEVRPLAWTVTDEDGRFTLEELFAGAYRAALVQTGHEVEHIELSVPLEGEVHWRLGAARAPIESLPELARTTLVGTVVDADRRPLAGLEVVLRPGPGNEPLSGALVRRAATDAEGRFFLEELVVADYVVELLPGWASGGSWPVLCSLPLAGAEVAAQAPLELVFEPATITARLQDVRARPIEGALVQLWAATDPNRVWPTVQTGPDGTFRLEGLPAGSFVLRVRAGAAALEQELSLSAGEARELELAPVDL